MDVTLSSLELGLARHEHREEAGLPRPAGVPQHGQVMPRDLHRGAAVARVGPDLFGRKHPPPGPIEEVLGCPIILEAIDEVSRKIEEA